MAHDSLENDDYVFDMSYEEVTEKISNPVKQIMNQNLAWDFLGEGEHNVVYRAKKEHKIGLTQGFLVKKESYSFSHYYVYQAKDKTGAIEFEHGNMKYWVLLDPEYPRMAQHDQQYNVCTKVGDEAQHLFVVSGETLFYIPIHEEATIEVLPTQIGDIKKLKKVLAEDQRHQLNHWLRPTSRTMMSFFELGIKYLNYFQVSPKIYNDKNLTLDLFKKFYPDCSIISEDEHGLIMPFFEQEATQDEAIAEMLRIVKEHDYCIVEGGNLKNFRKDKKGNVVFIKPNLALRINTQGMSSSETEVHNDLMEHFESKMSDHALQENDVTQVSWALYQVVKSLNGQALPKEWLNKENLKLFYAVSQRDPSVGLIDLEIMHKFHEIFITAFKNACQPYDLSIYHHCIKALVQKNQGEYLEIFLEKLSLKSNFIPILNSTFPYTPLTIAVKNGNSLMVSRLLKWGADPLVRHESKPLVLDSVNWALFMGDWGIIGLVVLTAIKNRTKLNSNRLWSESSATPISLKEKIHVLHEIDERVHFHQFFLDVVHFSKNVGNEQFKKLGLTVIGLQRNFLLDRIYNLEKGLKELIRGCSEYFSGKELLCLLETLSDEEQKNNINATIAKFENELYDCVPTSGCVIS